MTTNRLEAFSDGVLAIIITIMVLEIKTPHGTTIEAFKPMLPVFLAYVGSFFYIGFYWNNHHHLMQVAQKVNGKILWANLHLLFWLSLLPFATGWMGENHIQEMPVALYGFVLLMAAISYKLLTVQIIKNEGEDSILAQSLKNDTKGKISIIIYLTAFIVAFFIPPVSIVLYFLTAAMWFIPDKRIERNIN